MCVVDDAKGYVGILEQEISAIQLNNERRKSS